MKKKRSTNKQEDDVLRLVSKDDLEGILSKENIMYTGFIAQEVEAAAESIGFDFSGIDKPKNEHDYYGLRYAEFVVPLVKAVQEQQLIIDDLKRRITELEKSQLMIK